MATTLFDKIIFGPVKSRRLGTSLGINLLPIDSKVCSFDCVYCECGFTEKPVAEKLPTREEVKEALRKKLTEMKMNDAEPDVITFAGNGEPTLHPQFKEIVEDTIALRDAFFPNAKVSVLSNASLLQKPDVFEALNKVDNNILKLDSAIDSTLKRINSPKNNDISVEKIVSDLKRFRGNFILQTLFLRGKDLNGNTIDNTTPEELAAWMKVVKEVKPKQIMIYSLARETPMSTLEKVSKEELCKIADRMEKEGFNVSVA